MYEIKLLKWYLTQIYLFIQDMFYSISVYLDYILYLDYYNKHIVYN